MTKMIEKFRKDYQAPNFFVHSVYLTFTLDQDKTLVQTRITLNKNPHTHERSLTLNGDKALTLTRFSVNNQSISLTELNFDQYDLMLNDLPDKCTIEIENRINPKNNRSLEGLYLSNNIYCSDCEPEGFRHITFYPDRPDIMAIYTVKIIADKNYPMLLSNGNLIEEGKTGDQHYAVWHDPHPKPSYLFALVAGDLAFIEDAHIRPDGSPVILRIYVEKPYIHQCQFALSSLKKAFLWDEMRFGLICDLDHYNIVAVHDFNGGAMENKGLNIFNAKYVLADEHTATDLDFETIESIIGHEYFHNWTGNRITCRDWFQLSLKEGLTVFRDQEFTSDIRNRGLKRIDDVKLLRAHQFTEDAGALSHPIRPDSYVEMRNFYTATVYEKGAEVVRLYQTLLGKAGFKKGLDHYIHAFDGTAATCDDFLNSMRVANNAELSHFERWYSQGGTPKVSVTAEFDSAQKRLILKFTQILRNTPKQNNKQPQIIPINTALIDESGTLFLEQMIVLTEYEETITFDHIDKMPVVSLLREFSAPIIIEYPHSLEDLIHIVTYESDPFSRWEAMQKLVAELILSDDSLEIKKAQITKVFAKLLPVVLRDSAFFARLLKFPDASFVASMKDNQDLLLVHQIKKALEHHLAENFEEHWLNIYMLQRGDNEADRALKNIALYYLSLLNREGVLAQVQYSSAANMTDRMAALSASVICDHVSKNLLLNHFIEAFIDYPSVIDKWFSLQASNPEVDLATLNQLINHPLFSFENPNRVRSVLGAFGQNKIALLSNIEVHFHWLLDKIILLDGINPQGSARLATPFSQIQSLKTDDQITIKSLIQKALENNFLSKNLNEQLTKSL